MSISVPPGLQILLIVTAVLAGVYDIRYRRIPNWLVLSGLLAGLAMNAFLFELAGLKAAGMGFGLACLIYFPLYLLRAMGAGDVKLMAALGAIVGPGNWFVLFLITALLGGVCGVVLVLFKARLRKTFWNIGWILHEMLHLRAPYRSSEELDVRSDQALRMPHGAVIAASALVMLWIQAIRGIGKPLF